MATSAPKSAPKAARPKTDPFFKKHHIGLDCSQRIIIRMNLRQGKIIIEAGANVWPHELKTAEALAFAGFTIEFVRKSDVQHERTADVRINGLLWEMKAPKSSKLHMVEQNLRRALKQSSNIIFDSRRMKNLPDVAIERELKKWSKELSHMQRLLFVNRQANVIDIMQTTM